MNIWTIGIIGGIGSTLLLGPIGLVVFLIGYGFFFYYMKYRGLLFVQSYVFLKTLSQTNDVDMANVKANTLTSDDAYYHGDEAMMFAQKMCQGQTLRVMALAKQNGFKKNNLFNI